MPHIKVGIVEDNALVRENLALILNGSPGFRCVCACATAAEALQARVPTVLVPFSGGAETEQGLRARLLAERGAAEVVEESSLSAETLAAAVDRAVRRGRPPADLVDLDGAMRTAELLRQWCA